jgi:hypothetical protein
MGTSDQLKAKVDRLKKKLAAKGASLDAAKKRLVHKKLKRFQRAWRTALALEKRVAEKARGGKAPARAAEEKPSGAAPAAAPPEAAPPAS